MKSITKFKPDRFYKKKYNSDVMIQVKKVLHSDPNYVKILADWWNCAEKPAISIDITQEVVIAKEDVKLWREVK